jgi:transposase-like protein
LGIVPRTCSGWSGRAIRPIFRAGSLEEARRLLEETVRHLEGRVPKVARLLLEAESDLLAFYSFPVAHRSKLRSTNPWSGSTAKSAGAPTWWACSPTTKPSSAWLGAC